MAPSGDTYARFWPRYLNAHSRRGTRALHYVGTGLGLAAVGAAPWTSGWIIPLGIGAGYAWAWAGHLLVEHNRPAALEHPCWSLYSDLRMFGLALSGRLAGELERHLSPGP